MKFLKETKEHLEAYDLTLVDANLDPEAETAWASIDLPLDENGNKDLRALVTLMAEEAAYIQVADESADYWYVRHDERLMVVIVPDTGIKALDVFILNLMHSRDALTRNSVCKEIKAKLYDRLTRLSKFKDTCKDDINPEDYLELTSLSYQESLYVALLLENRWYEPKQPEKLEALKEVINNNLLALNKKLSSPKLYKNEDKQCVVQIDTIGYNCGGTSRWVIKKEAEWPEFVSNKVGDELEYVMGVEDAPCGKWQRMRGVQGYAYKQFVEVEPGYYKDVATTYTTIVEPGTYADSLIGF